MVPVEVKANPCQGKQNPILFSPFLSLSWLYYSCFVLFFVSPFLFPSLYPFAKEYGGDFPYHDSSTFHSRHICWFSVHVCESVHVNICMFVFCPFLHILHNIIYTCTWMYIYVCVYLSMHTCAPMCSFLQPVVQITYFCLTTASSRGGAHMQKATWKGLLVAVSFYYALRCHVC